MAAPINNRVLKKFTKTVTFDGGTGTGAVGTVAIAAITGSVLCGYTTARCKTTLVGAGTLELGVSGNTAALIAQIADATGLVANDFWIGSTSPAGVAAAILDKTVTGNLILTVGSTAITAGVLEFIFYYLPLSADGNMG